jgi:xeroderma pigmentosum group C-complementing protein
VKQQIHNASKSMGDGKLHLFASWQTDPWSPPVVEPNDPIPANEYGNIELDLLNPGLVHLDLRGVAMTAKKLSIPYKPCLLGFEGHGGNRTPTIRGIVVHLHNETLLREAHAEVSDHLQRNEDEAKNKAILRRWKRLLVGVLTKDRLDREYGNDEIES